MLMFLGASPEIRRAPAGAPGSGAGRLLFCGDGRSRSLSWYPRWRYFLSLIVTAYARFPRLELLDPFFTTWYKSGLAAGESTDPYVDAARRAPWPAGGSDRAVFEDVFGGASRSAGIQCRRFSVEARTHSRS